MKVCHFTSTHGNKDQRILIKECCSLAKAGYEVCQVAQGDSGEYNGVKLIGTGETNKSSLYRLIIRPRKVYKLALAQDADIYQIHDMELLPYAVKLKKRGKIVIFDYHEDFASRFEDSDIFHLPRGIMKIFGRMYNRYESKAIAKLDAMISVTPHICKRLKESNPNTVMVTNYPIIDKENPWASEALYDESSNYICFAGQVSCVQYALDTVVKAIQSIPGIRFRVYGNERRAGDIDFLQSIDEQGKMDYKGTVPFFELPKILSGSKAAIVTAAYSKDTSGRYGTLGNNKLFEAMLRAVPVVFTNFDLWKEINDKYSMGIPVEQGNIEEMRNAITWIVQNPAESRAMGLRGREAVFKEYNWKTQEDVLFRLYSDLTRKGKR